MRTFACVLKTGGDYNADHVRILQNQVRRAMPSTERFVCLTDLPEIEGVETMPLLMDLPGKYSMVEVFWITGQVVVTGLDTVLKGDLDDIWDVAKNTGPNTFWVMKSFNAKRQYGNNPMVWNGNWTKLIENYPPRICLKHPLEQECTFWKLRKEGAEIKVLDDLFTIKSYKHNYIKSERPKGDQFIIFHGDPRPHQVTVPWVKELYQ